MAGRIITGCAIRQRLVLQEQDIWRDVLLVECHLIAGPHVQNLEMHAVDLDSCEYTYDGCEVNHEEFFRLLTAPRA